MRNLIVFMLVFLSIASADSACAETTEVVLPLFDWCKPKLDMRSKSSIIWQHTKIEYTYFTDVNEIKSSIVGVMKIRTSLRGMRKSVAINTIKHLCLPYSTMVENFSRDGLSGVIQFIYSKGNNNLLYLDMKNKKIYAQTLSENN